MGVRNPTLLACLLTLWSCGGVEQMSQQSDEVFKPQVSSTDVDLTEIEALAVTSCACKMQGGDDESCERQLDAAVGNINAMIRGSQANFEEAAEAATACAPVSTESVCFNFSDGEKCVVVGYNVNGASKSFENRFVCSREQARAIELAYSNDGFDGVDEMLRRIQAGEAYPSTAPGGGCVG